jgi:membrane-bound serine protease (ClpP class)
MKKIHKIKLFLSILLLAFVFLPSSIQGQEAQDINPIDIFYIMEFEGIIDPNIDNYIAKGLKTAEEEGGAVIIIMDTPGGLDDSMRSIIKNMLNTKAPVIVYVYPTGSRAASAGVFISYASDIAAMSPGTSIGAAHPVTIGGQEVSEEVIDKILNDSVSYIRGLAAAKGRNEIWAEEAVRQSVSITSDEALAINVIDYLADDLEDLFQQIDGLEIEKLDERFLLSTKDADVREIPMRFFARLLHLISNPNIAYVLFILGILGIIYEFSQPGIGVPGALGAIFLILAFYAFSVLPINYAGVGLIVLAVILIILDVVLGIEGVLSVAGVIALIIGSFILVESDAPYLQIARSLIIGASIVFGGFLAIVLRAVYKAHKVRPKTGKTGIIGETGKTIDILSPEGQIAVHGEIWRAVSADKSMIEKDREVEVVSIEGLTLFVKEIKKGD